MSLTVVNFIHSNDGSEVAVFAETVFGVQFLPKNQTWVLLASGGAMIPVAGTRDEIVNKIVTAKKAAAKPAKKESK